jgi:hypothetical protein
LILRAWLLQTGALENILDKAKGTSMKTTILKTFGVASVLAIILAASVARADSYTLTIQSGWNSIANQLNNPGGNTLDQILPLPDTGGDNDGSGVYKWDAGIQNYLPTSYWDGFALAWGDNFTLSPGEGAILNYAGPSFTLTFTGTQVSAPVLITPVPNKVQYVSDQLPEVGTWNSIIAVPPGAGTKVYRMDNATGEWGAPDIFDGTSWSLGAPTANVGEAWNLYFVPVPEPSTCGLLLTGLAGLLAVARNKKR